MPLEEFHRQTHKPRKDIAADIIERALTGLDKTTDPPVGDDGLDSQNDKESKDRPVDVVGNTLDIDRPGRLQRLCKGSGRTADELSEIVGKGKGESRRDK